MCVSIKYPYSPKAGLFSPAFFFGTHKISGQSGWKLIEIIELFYVAVQKSFSLFILAPEFWLLATE